MTHTIIYSSYGTPVALVLLAVRLFLGLMIFAHGYNKVFRGGGLAGTAGWFDSMGMRPGKLNATLAAGTEMGVGVLLSVGLLTTFAAAGLVSVMTVAILTVHRKNGFFIINKGGGIEYCLGIAVAALVPGVLGAGRYSLDYAWNVLTWTKGTDLLIVLLLGVGGALFQLAIFYRPPKSTS
ncbi:MAG: DoxX family protein [Acidimicrobiales bacterium]|jgi:putative oxidoreductase